MFGIVLLMLYPSQIQANTTRRPVNITQTLDYEIEAVIRNPTSDADPEALLDKIKQHTAVLHNLTVNIDKGPDEVKQAEEVVNKGYAAYLYIDFYDKSWFKNIQKIFKWTNEQRKNFKALLERAEDTWIELVKKYSHKTCDDLHF